jgi:hypothetical protein
MNKERYLYSALASAVGARLRCKASGNTEWYGKWEDQIESLVAEHLPSGSGFDSGTKLDLEKSHADKLVFTTSYHHMDEAGGYDGWTEHVVVVTPSFQGFNIRVSGRNRNDIKYCIDGEFHSALSVMGEFQIEGKNNA